MNILGIETSCDETAAAVVTDGVRVRSNIVASQVDLHAKYGGVVPEIASRAHIERLDSVIEEAMSVAGIAWPRAAGTGVAWPRSLTASPNRGDSNLDSLSRDVDVRRGHVVPEVDSATGRVAWPRGHLTPAPDDVGTHEARAPGEDLQRGHGTHHNIDAVAVTNRPGLVGALIIGVTAAKALAWAWGKPLIGVDHIRAHAYSPAIGLEKPPWPAVGLIVSGGHTSLFRIESPLDIELLGATTDDAAGEAFDKVSTILGLPYPGGPMIEKIARNGDPKAVDFPRTMLGPDSLDFSFSGIKTAVLYHVHGPGKTSGGLEKLSEQQIADIAASFQQAVIDVLVRKTMLAVAQANSSSPSPLPRAERDQRGTPKGMGDATPLSPPLARGEAPSARRPRTKTGTADNGGAPRSARAVSTVVLGGGVAANKALRSALETECHNRGLKFHAAPMAYCTDNAAMIAALGHHLLQAGQTATLELDAYASAS